MASGPLLKCVANTTAWYVVSSLPLFLQIQANSHKIFARKVVEFPPNDRQLRQLVLNEVRVLSTIRHPNIVMYEESFLDPDRKHLHM